MRSDATGSVSPPRSDLDRRSLATSLVPIIRRDTELRLGEIAWFRADWQRGGAATGRSTWKLDDGREVEVIVKLPVPHRELTWQQRLQPTDGSTGPAEDLVVPFVYAGGHTLNGYDMAWIVMEAVPEGPLGMKWDENHVPRIADALARFHAATGAWEVDRPPKLEDWAALLARAEKALSVNKLADATRWRRLVRRTRKRCDTLVDRWRARPIDGWIHGDAHLANAMSRRGIDDGPVVLIDLAEVHPGHWIEDAILLERMLWARPDRLAAVSPVTAVARARRDLGLPVRDEHAEYAAIRRLLLAASAPDFLRTEGNPRHLAACLEHGERSLAELG